MSLRSIPYMIEMVYNFIMHSNWNYRKISKISCTKSLNLRRVGPAVQDPGLGSRSSPRFNTLLVWLLVVPLSKALHAALLLSTQEEMGTCEDRFVSRGAKLRVSGCIFPRELRWISRRIWTVKGPMTREGTCQSLQSRALSLDVDSKQWLYFFKFIWFSSCSCVCPIHWNQGPFAISNSASLS